jgi:hypothetical protein
LITQFCFPSTLVAVLGLDFKQEAELGVVDGCAGNTAACHAGGLGSIPGPDRPTFRVEKVGFFCNPVSGGLFSSTAMEITKWVKIFPVAQAKVFYILRPGNTAFKEQLKLVNGIER